MFPKPYPEPADTRLLIGEAISETVPCPPFCALLVTNVSLFPYECAVIRVFTVFVSVLLQVCAGGS